MRIRVIGAAGGEVTGSAYFVQTKRASVLVDCGSFQGGRAAEAKNRPPTRTNTKLDAVVVTHGHLDHTGRLPLLPKLGFQGPVYATPATVDMAALILRDSARLQAMDAQRQNRKRARAGEPPIAPLYTPEDAEAIIGQFKPSPYRRPVSVAPGVRACFAEAGHMLGSASVQLLVDEDGRGKRVVFSGDLGPTGVPIQRNFEALHQADAVFLECTYGDRDHRPFRETAEEFIGIVKKAVETRGKILIPTFAVGRAQLLTALLSWAFRNKRVKPFPLFLDSPMAIEATKLYVRYYLKDPELFDEALLKYLRQKPMREDLKTLKATVSAEESRAINGCPGPCLVMAGAGMCTGGRILHHFKENLWRPETHVVIVGYQGRGSLGRRLVDGAASVSIFGEKISVRAQVHTLGGFSAHAGQTDLLRWLGAIAPRKPRVVLIHGEDGPRQALAQQIRQRHGLTSSLPKQGDVIEL
jgi:metallo-beta-lactamase family protein